MKYATQATLESAKKKERTKRGNVRHQSSAGGRCGGGERDRRVLGVER